MTQSNWRTHIRKYFFSFTTLVVISFMLYSHHGNLGKGGTVHPAQVYFKNENAIKPYINRPSVNDTPTNEQPDNQHVIIFTLRRSGSTFTSEIFNQNDDYMYFFEPLRSYEIMKMKTDPSVRAIPRYQVVPWSYSKQLLSALYRCDFTELPNWTRLRDLCFHIGTDPIRSMASYCRSKKNNNLAAMCRKHKGIAIKTIRVSDIQNLYDLVTDPKLNFKVIHLVRDPRGIMNSRYKTLKKVGEVRAERLYSTTNGNSGPEPMRANEVSEICTHMERNLKYWLDTPEWLAGRYKLVRYEDLAGNPLSVTRDLYNFIQTPLPHSVTQWIDRNTKHTTGKGKVTTRNSNITAYQWQTELDRSVIDDVQHRCKKLLDMLGYELV
ncbi:carbohydrate sulfotransferase 1-like [Amphiura filiformis]|uniref:carbohydrate sulfotransferase 1-like n=1 Tax=Amphiura filiformis TaxID=82378 RepID=UPI003B218802